MPTIYLDKKVKKELEDKMGLQIKKEIKQNPKLIKKLVKRYYTHNEFVSLLLKNFKIK